MSAFQPWSPARAGRALLEFQEGWKKEDAQAQVSAIERVYRIGFRTVMEAWRDEKIDVSVLKGIAWTAVLSDRTSGEHKGAEKAARYILGVERPSDYGRYGEELAEAPPVASAPARDPYVCFLEGAIEKTLVALREEASRRGITVGCYLSPTFWVEIKVSGSVAVRQQPDEPCPLWPITGEFANVWIAVSHLPTLFERELARKPEDA